MERVERGWKMMTQSWGVLMQDKRLMIFPLFSLCACLGILGVAYLGLDSNSEIVQMFTGERIIRRFSPQTYGLLFSWYLAMYFVLVFCNSALVSCTLVHFDGGRPTLRGGVQAAMARLPQIVAWALFAATIGTILKAIEDRVQFVGKIVVRITGVAFALGAYLVVPILVVEGLGPIAAIRRSIALLRKSWGESLTAEVSLGMFGFLATIPFFFLMAIAAFAHSQSDSSAVVFVALAIFYLVAYSVFSSACQQIFIASAYVWATQGRMSGGLSESDYLSAFPETAGRGTAPAPLPGFPVDLRCRKCGQTFPSPYWFRGEICLECKASQQTN